MPTQIEIGDGLAVHVDRTDAKLRYAEIHLGELETYQKRGSADDFESAHQEAFLYHLWGALDSFLQELNVIYRCQLNINKVTIKNLRVKLKAEGRASPELQEIERLLESEEDWLSFAKEMRDHSTHRLRVPRVFYKGGPLSGQVRLRHPKSGKEADSDWATHFTTLYDKMVDLIGKLRSAALARASQYGEMSNTG